MQAAEYFVYPSEMQKQEYLMKPQKRDVFFVENRETFYVCIRGLASTPLVAW